MLPRQTHFLVNLFTRQLPIIYITPVSGALLSVWQSNAFADGKQCFVRREAMLCSERSNAIAIPVLRIPWNPLLDAVRNACVIDFQYKKKVKTESLNDKNAIMLNNIYFLTSKCCTNDKKHIILPCVRNYYP